MVDQLGFSRRTGSFGQFLVPADHIYKGRFTHVGPAYKCVFGPVGSRAFFHFGTADQVNRLLDVHAAKIGSRTSVFFLNFGLS